MLLLCIIITIVLILLIILGVFLEKNWLESTAGTILGFFIFFGWVVFGCGFPVKTYIKIVPKEKYEILIGENKIVVTNLFNNSTQTFTDAKTYNLIAKKRDKYFLEVTNSNMYGYHLKDVQIQIEDSIYFKK